MRFNWKRFIWIVFMCLYSGLFFFNFFESFNNWHIPYLYTMILIIWLCVEYYEKRFFFQSGFVPAELYNWLPRALFALFFYSSFIIGCATIVWWQSNRINLYPFVQISGIALLVYSIYLRRLTFGKKVINEQSISKFYLSIFFLTISVALGYGSIFLIPYTIIIGCPLILLQQKYEKRHFKKFEEFVRNKKGADKIETENYVDLSRKYLKTDSKKRGKK